MTKTYSRLLLPRFETLYFALTTFMQMSPMDPQRPWADGPFNLLATPSQNGNTINYTFMISIACPC